MARKKKERSESEATGKMPPCAIDLEEVVLGAMMLDRNALNEVIDLIQDPQCFYKEAHQLVYIAIQSLFSNSHPVDILTVTQELRRQGNLDAAGGPYAISQLTSRVASGVNSEYHARILIQKYMLRSLIQIGAEITKESYDDSGDVFEILNNAEKKLFDVSQGNVRKNYDSISSAIAGVIKEIEAARSVKTGITGVPSGFEKLDGMTSGWQRSDLIILAARPAMGKTSFMLSLVRNAALDHKMPIAVFSLEMSTMQLVSRLISGESNIPADKLRRGQLSDEEFSHINFMISELSESKIYIDDSPALSIFELRAKARKMVHQHGVELIVIDYLQLMQADDDKFSREQEVSKISRGLKSIAKELKIPVIALSQLNRSVEARGGDKKPQLSDLRESGAIEQDADMVLFLHRPEYYGIYEDGDGIPTHGVCEVIIAKHRNGAVASTKVHFIESLAKFADFETGQQPSTQTPTSPAPMEVVHSEGHNDGDETEDDSFF